ncbi:head maturation protease, ClpP-related [Micromonospora haikouensis]|uniref:head maturation protease, ClpP-related n=1 Tax=Micromonospora haikouensis TaxID=686309 RepID=UPI003D75B64A
MLRRRILNRAGLRTARPRAQLRQGRTDWYAIRNAASPVAEVLIYDEIGYWGVTAEDFVRELQGVTAPAIELRINSPGGEVFDGIAIMNALRAHPASVTAYVDGLAASAASFIFQAGDVRVMRPQSQLMIHDAMGLCVGNGADMRQMADELDRISDTIASVYAERGDGTVARWRERMRAETWYGPDEAVAAGLADQVATTGSTNRMPRRENAWDLTIFGTDGRTGGPAGDATPAARESVAVVARTAPPTVPEPVEAAAAPASTGPAPAPPEPGPDIADVPDWTDDLASAFRDAFRPPEESELAAAFRAALHPDGPEPADIPAIDPTEFYNAILEATS